MLTASFKARFEFKNLVHACPLWRVYLNALHSDRSSITLWYKATWQAKI